VRTVKVILSPIIPRNIPFSVDKEG